MAFSEAGSFPTEIINLDPSVLQEVEREGGDIPEHQLLNALLCDAVYTCLNFAHSSKGSGRRRFQEAWSWFNTPRPDYLFSSDNVCAFLGLNLDNIRGRLNELCRVAQSRKRRRR